MIEIDGVTIPEQNIDFSTKLYNGRLEIRGTVIKSRNGHEIESLKDKEGSKVEVIGKDDRKERVSGIYSLKKFKISGQNGLAKYRAILRRL